MTPDELKARTKKFALHTLKMCDSLPQSRSGYVLANQLIRSATSVGANYRAACRARSSAEFVAKIGIALEEADESIYWLELIGESGIRSGQEVSDLKKEDNELVAIFVASSNTAQRRLGRATKTNLKSEI